MRKTEFANDEYYHICNRGVDKREVFLDNFDYYRFLLSMQEFNRTDPIGSIFENSFRKDKKINSPVWGRVSVYKIEKLVEVVAYCLNPNHYHFILKQLSDNGISKFMLKLGSGYSSYFNNKTKRSGSLFQGPFKAIHINSNEYLLHVSAYVNCNSEIHGAHKADNYKWCSFPEYIGEKKGGLCNKEIILGQFKNKEEYKEYARTVAREMKNKKEMEKLLLE
ncbi:MAG: transposase [Parcubacteria group bacterium]